ncbi:hypothetical protein Bca4012_020117 [Brassica carinata]|uniref:Transmembrane protein n=1 Tax=Brassica carinata TaxID=52824 RepID=A0A8X8BDD6_BRACI|nr:hypothetical protein Bca52824_001458 [Brassica carinata]
MEQWLGVGAVMVRVVGFWGYARGEYRGGSVLSPRFESALTSSSLRALETYFSKAFVAFCCRRVMELEVFFREVLFRSDVGDVVYGVFKAILWPSSQYPFFSPSLCCRRSASCVYLLPIVSLLCVSSPIFLLATGSASDGLGLSLSGSRMRRSTSGLCVSVFSAEYILPRWLDRWLRHFPAHWA